ncbi:MAG TPA: glycosyltransferase [Bryobacteraceae bacterium]|nr:glycosyltransferase [Bryobacteraceae bacterium]
MKKVDFVFFDAGGGHRSAATALKAVIEEQQRPWQVRLVNLQEVLEPLDIFKKLTGIRMEDVYNKLLKKGWTLGSEYLVPVMHAIIRAYHPAQRRMLTDFWRAAKPDMVVGVIPNFNRAIFQALQQVDPRIPMVTILTDFADYPPHFWMERQDQYLICGTEKALQQAQAMGFPPEKTFLTSGMIVRPMFYCALDHDRGSERARLGLRPDLPTGVVLFGGQGSNVMVQIARKLIDCAKDFQLILICGKNEKLANRLRAMQGKNPMHVVGFTHEVPYYMHLSDFFIGKPGPGSISEALAMNLPVVVERNAWTLPQERYNAEWVREKQVGIVLDSFQHIVRGMDELLEPATFARVRANALAIQNHAIHEIPDILESILQKHS